MSSEGGGWRGAEGRVSLWPNADQADRRLPGGAGGVSRSWRACRGERVAVQLSPLRLAASLRAFVNSVGELSRRRSLPAYSDVCDSTLPFGPATTTGGFFCHPGSV